MAEKNMKARVIHKHDVEANWNNATGFTPMKGEIIVYDIDSNYAYERIKIGDGQTAVTALPFADDNLKNEILNYVDEALLNSQADWAQTDSASLSYIKNKPDEDDAFELVLELGLIEPTVDENGSIYTDENGIIYTVI